MLRQDLPLDLVVVADLGLDRGQAANGRLHRVDAENFAAFMAGLNLEARIESPAGVVPLAVGSIKDLRPENIATRLPDAAALLALRERVVQHGLEKRALEGLIAALPEGSPLRHALRAALAPPAPSGPAVAAAPPAPAPLAPLPRMTPETSNGDSVDALFDMVDAGGTPAPAAAAQPAPRAPSASTRALDRLVGLLGATSGTQAGSATQAKLASMIDETLSEAVRAVLHAPDFRRIEQDWLGLRFLTRRIDFRTGVRLFVLPVWMPTVGVNQALKTFLEDRAREGRVVVVLADFELGDDNFSPFELAELAEVTLPTRSPVVTAVNPEFLGPAHLDGLDEIESLASRVADDRRADWQTAMARTDNRHVCVVANHFLLRLPYGAEHDRVKGFAFEENLPGEPPQFRWGRGVWAVGERIAASYVRSGWGTELIGQGEDDVVADLPVRMLRTRSGEEVMAPLEALISERQAMGLAQLGVTPLLCRKGGDAAFLAIAPMLGRAGAGTTATGAEARRDSLPFAMMVAQVRAWVAQLSAEGRFADDAEKAAALAKGIEFLSMNADGATLEARAEGSTIRVTPYRPPLRGLPDFVISLDRPN